MMENNFHRFITKDGAAVLSIVDSTGICREVRRLHNTSATMTAVMGQAVTAASLMGYGLKDKGNTLTLTVKGDGPAGTITAVSDWLGNVRCCCDDPSADLPALVGGNFDIGRAIGRHGDLYVVKDLGMDAPYVGEIALTDGELAQEITRYYAVSEQVPTVCSLGCIVDRDLSVARAGGFLLQLLPYCPEEVIDRIEQNLKDAPGMTVMLDEGRSFTYVANRLLAGLEPEELDVTTAEYRCTCSRERMERVLISLGEKELLRLAEEQENTEIVCHFCNSRYVFSSEEMRELAAESVKDNGLTDENGQPEG